jgi:hypothetical protein
MIRSIVKAGHFDERPIIEEKGKVCGLDFGGKTKAIGRLNSARLLTWNARPAYRISFGRQRCFVLRLKEASIEG